MGYGLWVTGYLGFLISRCSNDLLRRMLISRCSNDLLRRMLISLCSSDLLRRMLISLCSNDLLKPYKFKISDGGWDGGIPPKTEHRCAYSPEQRRALNDYRNIRGWKPRTQDTNHTRSWKSRAQDTAPALEAPDTEHTGGSKSRAGIKFRRNERSMGGGIPPETGHRYAYSLEQRRALNDYTNIRG